MEVYQASFTGLFKTIFIVIGVLVVLRFVGKLLTAKREQDKVRQLEKEKRDIQKAQEQAAKTKGQITVNKETKANDGDTIDVDYTEA